MHIFKKILFFCLFSFHCFASIDSEFYPLVPVLSQLPGWDEKTAQIEPISGGQTNHNFKLTLPDQTYFVRLGSDAPDLLGLSSAREYECSYLASQAGFSPPVILYAPEQHILVTPFIRGQAPRLNHPAALKQVVDTIKHFHASTIVFPTIFSPYRVIDEYYTHAIHLNQAYKETLDTKILPLVEEIKRVIPTFSTLCPCHLDLYNQNFLDDKEKIWMIDWEYSAMADPLYDLATFISSNYLSTEQMKDVLMIYSKASSVEDLSYLYLMTLLVDIRWGLWCLIQAEVSTIESNYKDSGALFFERALIKASSPLYQESITLWKNKD